MVADRGRRPVHRSFCDGILTGQDDAPLGPQCRLQWLIQCSRCAGTGWTIAPLARDNGVMMPHDRKPLTVVKLSDYGGQYVLMLKCSACGHSREARPDLFARFAGWEASLASVVGRLRCSKCGVRRCTAAPRREMKRDG